jgi:membrane associated rhomboid family serine protease
VYGRGTQGAGLGFGPPVTPPVVKQLLIANAVIFAAQTLTHGSFDALLAVRPVAVWQGYRLWQPFTYMWLHGGLGHLLMNLLALWMFGSQVALAWGAQRFLRYYLVCGVGAGFIIASYPYLGVLLGLASPASLGYVTLGASGAIFGVLLAYSLTWPDRTIMLIFPPVAFRAIWLIPILFLLEIYMDPLGNVSHTGHLGGVIVGWLYLRRGGTATGLPTLNQLKWRWRRHRMRQKLRTVKWEDDAARTRRRDEQRNDRTIH